MENTYTDVRVSGVKVKGDTLSTTCGQLDKEQFVEGGEGEEIYHCLYSIPDRNNKNEKKGQFKIRMFKVMSLS